MILKLPEKKKENIRSALFLLLLISGLCVTAALFLSLGKLSALHRQADEIRETMTEWQEKAKFINGKAYRPVLAEQIDAVSSDIFHAVEAHHLELIAYQSLHHRQEETEFQTFSLSVKGSYANSIAFLEDFRAKDALITIMSTTMYPLEENIQTDLRYRVYIK